MTALGVHTVDTFNYLVGPGRARRSRSRKKVVGTTALDEATAVTIEYESGPIGQIGTSYFVPPVVSLAVYGTDANVWNEEDGGSAVHAGRADKARAERDVEQIDTIQDEIAEFATCIRDGGEPETGARRAWRSRWCSRGSSEASSRGVPSTSPSGADRGRRRPLDSSWWRATTALTRHRPVSYILQPMGDDEGTIRGPVDAFSVPRFAGISTFARLPMIDEVGHAGVGIVGVPFDSGVTYRPGARLGPSAIRAGSRLLRPFDPTPAGIRSRRRRWRTRATSPARRSRRRMR